MSQISQTYNQSIIEELGSVYQEDAYTLRHIFLLLARNHYAQPNYFGDVPVSFQNFKYSDDPSECSVKIELDHTFNPEKAENETAIYVGISDIITQKQVMDSFTNHNEDLSGREHADLDSCSVTISHVASTYDESAILGSISKGFFQGIRQKVLQNTGIQYYQISRLTKPRNIRQNKSIPLYQSDLVIDLKIVSAWQSSIESHRIKKVSLEFK